MRLMIGNSRSAAIPWTYCGVTAVSSMTTPAALTVARPLAAASRASIATSSSSPKRPALIASPPWRWRVLAARGLRQPVVSGIGAVTTRSPVIRVVAGKGGIGHHPPVDELPCSVDAPEIVDVSSEGRHRPPSPVPEDRVHHEEGLAPGVVVFDVEHRLAQQMVHRHLASGTRWG